MPWKKGQSGNPNGRPKKSRALTAILETAGSKTREDVDGKRRSGKRIMARALWELATTGRTTLPRDGSVYEIKIQGDGWFDVVKWLYQHIDGPPKVRAEISGPEGGPIETKATGDYSPAEHARAIAALVQALGSTGDQEDGRGQDAMDAPVGAPMAGNPESSG